MSAGTKAKTPELDRRSWALLIAAVLALLVLFVRLWYLQVVKADELKRKATTISWRKATLPAARGAIVDRNGKLLAGSESKLVVSVIPALAEKSPQVFNWLEAALGLPVEALRSEVEKNRWKRYSPTPITIGVGIDLASQIAEAALEMPAIRVDSHPMRTYPDTRSFCHLLGYVWTPSSEDLQRLKAKGLKPAEYVGKSGVEAAYEAQLLGRDGVERYEVEGENKWVRLMERQPARPGSKLVLTIDSELQRHANEQLDGRVGAIVALEPATGGVLAMASSPGYDTAPFLTGISQEDYDELSQDPDKPFLNRATSGIYAPGSTFKIVTTLAAVRAGKFDPQRDARCRGYYEVGVRQVKCLGVHGSVSFSEAMTKSCNAYFADLAVRTGEEAIKKAALAAGLGNRTGLDLGAEARGVVPTDAWRRENLPADQFDWHLGDTVNLGIGQGRVATTPLQMACVAALAANRGIVYKPHILKEVVSAGRVEQYKLEVLGQIDAPEEVWQTLNAALTSVIERGTARSAQIYGITWAGKTGSTEHRRDEETHSWFVGYAPAENPQIAVAVLIEKAGHGGEVAAPIAADIVRFFLRDASR